MAVSEEELQAKRDRVQKLREQVATENAKRLEREVAVSNELHAAQLDAEEAMLNAQLAVAKAGNSASAVKAGAEGSLSTAKEQMQAAAEQQKALDKANQKEGN